MNFENLNNHTIDINNFKLKWRFTEEKYDVLPQIHLNQLKPLDLTAANFLSEFISKTGLHNSVPFKHNFFQHIDKIDISIDNEKEVKKWLYQRALPFDKKVYLSYDEDTAMIVPWKILIKYFDSFYYSDDLTVFDESLEWALLFFHEDRIYFGTNKKYSVIESKNDLDFLE